MAGVKGIVRVSTEEVEKGVFPPTPGGCMQRLTVSTDDVAPEGRTMITPSGPVCSVLAHAVVAVGAVVAVFA